MIYEFTLEEAQILLKTHTHEEAGKEYGYATHSGFTRRYNRLKARALETQRKQNIAKKKRTVTLDRSRDTALVFNPQKLPTQEQLTQIRRATYGSIPPTMQREDIQSMDQLVAWIKKFTPYMQNDFKNGDWDNSNTRENAQVLFFDVFKQGKSSLIGKPRDSGKSKISVAVYTCILANYYYPQGIIVNGPKAKRRIFNGLYRTIVKNPLFRYYYGDILSSKNKIEGVMELADELIIDLYEREGYVTDDPVIQISVYSGIIGAHPYVVWLEDMLQSEFRSDESNEYMLYEVFDAIIYRLSGRIGGTLTRKGPGDLYSHLPSRGLLLIVRKAIEIIRGEWPGITDLIYDDRNERAIAVHISEGSEFRIIERPGWTVQSLLLERTLSLQDVRSYEMFEREMQNNPILSEGAYFKPHWWSVVQAFDTTRFTKYLVADTAFGMKETADYNCIGVWVIYNQVAYLTELKLVRNLEFDAICNMIAVTAKETKATRSWVHATLKEVWVTQRLRKLMPGVTNVDEKREKIERINVLDTPFKDGMIKVFNSIDPKTLKEAHTQYLTYDRTPSNASRKDDFLDMCATAYEKLQIYLYDNRRGKIEMMH